MLKLIQNPQVIKFNNQYLIVIQKGKIISQQLSLENWKSKLNNHNKFRQGAINTIISFNFQIYINPDSSILIFFSLSKL